MALPLLAPDDVGVGGPLADASLPLSSSCPLFRARWHLHRLARLCQDWLFELPLEEVAAWLHDDMVERWRRRCFDDTPTGGALVWLPAGSGSIMAPGDSGCLVHPAGDAMNQLCILWEEVARPS